MAAFQSQFVALIRGFAATALDQGDLPASDDPDRLAFELNGIILAADTNFVLHDDPAVLNLARQVVHQRLRLGNDTNARPHRPQQKTRTASHRAHRIPRRSTVQAGPDQLHLHPCVAPAELDADFVQPRFQCAVECEIRGGQRVGQLLDSACAKNNRSDARMCQHPSD